MYLADSLLERIRVNSTELLKCWFLVRAENRPGINGEKSLRAGPHEFNPHSASIFRINDPRIHKLLAFVFWLSANHDNIIWMITRGNTNWTAWPSHVGDNRTECSISFMSFISFIHSSRFESPLALRPLGHARRVYIARYLSLILQTTRVIYAT